jgi:hypothetical protein
MQYAHCDSFGSLERHGRLHSQNTKPDENKTKLQPNHELAHSQDMTTTFSNAATFTLFRPILRSYNELYYIHNF